MAIIKRLDETLANMIAAGEVIERPASIVKELIENSLDANAKEIEINLTESGIKRIEIIDDGVGMDKEDAQMAFYRHATSKISNQHDLYRINTLGFRGEAIPSIAAVSLITLITSQGSSGYYVKYKAGKLIEEGEIATNKGTHIIVENLFFNTPARLKYIKAPNIELANIIDYVDKIALSHPNVRFTLTNNKSTLLRTNGYGNMESLFGEIYGIDVARNTTMFEAKREGIEIKGYLVAPYINKSRKNHITLVVNRRVVKNQRIVNSVAEGYLTYMPIGRYPIAVIFIDIDPMLIDVNVHPAKLEVKFAEDDEIRSFIMESIKNALTMNRKMITEIKDEKPIEQYRTEDIFTIPSIYQTPEKLTETMTNLVEEEKICFSEAYEIEKPKLPFLQYIGQFSGTYLLCQNEEGLFILDQHAAAERIRYEYYYEKLGEVNNNSQSLLLPINLELTKKETLYVLEHKALLEDMGFEIEESGINSFYVRSVPLWIKDDVLEISEQIINYIIENNSIDIKKIRNSLAASISCKGAIKGNQRISNEEVDYLLENLARCENPYTCPHGRPTIIKFTNYEIEKMFKRVM